ncbi:porin [Noviherbaspirillum galbum]|uniref:Porin n=1 Tax=Noviherbaspirillum galbum TaxID=2709383 RepID=A0A6B3SY73_9BURK|nr:porin [Noviherbaspirillum galbum]NEX64236.1 porin [Noviherbaspirillum galbum]
MKKSLLALAVLGAFAGVAQAQTAVQIYGSFDGGLRQTTNVDAAGNSRLSMGSTGTYNSNRIGFKGVEDLGGGMNGHFTLETGFNTGTGALNNATNQLFERTAAVGLGFGANSLDLGRQYTVAFKTIAAYDPFSYKYPGIALAVPATAGTRYNNDIQYTGTFGPVTARAEYALGEVAGDRTAGSNRAIGVNYANGPLALGGAYTQRFGDAPTDFRTKHWTVGGAYKFGPARLAVGYADQKAETAAGIDTTNKWYWVGLNYAISPAVEITPAFYRQKQGGGTGASGAATSLEGKKDLYMLSVTYAFSKRTNFYALIDQSRLDNALRVGGNAAANQDRQRDIAVGINHLF